MTRAELIAQAEAWTHAAQIALHTAFGNDPLHDAFMAKAAALRAQAERAEELLPRIKGEVEWVNEEANNYCLILTALGMEEEGDPVAEVKRLKALAEQAPEAVHTGYRGLPFAEAKKRIMELPVDAVRGLAISQLIQLQIADKYTTPPAAEVERLKAALRRLEMAARFVPVEDNTDANPDAVELRAALRDAAAALGEG